MQPQNLPRCVYKKGTTTSRLTSLSTSKYLCNPELKQYIDYYLKYPENVMYLIVVYDRKYKTITGYMFKDVLTNVVHYGLHPAPKADFIKNSLIREYARCSQQTPEEVKTIFSNLS
jgi:hypothetical protein